MRIAEVIGRVTLNRCHPSLRGATWKVVVPLNRQGLLGEEAGRGEPFVIYDERGAGTGSLLAISSISPESKTNRRLCRRITGRSRQSLKRSRDRSGCQNPINYSLSTID